MHEYLELGLQLFLWVGMGAGAWFYLTTCVGALRVLRTQERTVARVEVLPAVTVLKPLKGLDADLFENLSTFCRQDYPEFQLVFGVADAKDPAIQVVQRLREHYPNTSIDLVIDPRVYGTNYKVSNLENMYARARYDTLVIADSDIRVRSDYLRRVVAPLADPRVGLATCLYRAVSTGDGPSRVESLCINTDFVPMVLVAGVVETPTYAFGATMALRRSVLEEIGGFRALTNYLADDYFLGHRVAERGYRLALADLVVETVLAVGTWSRLLDHQLRWARTYRSVRPLGYFGAGLTHGVAWATIHLAYNGYSSRAWIVWLSLATLRALTAWVVCNRFLLAPLRIAEAALVPLKDLGVFAVWAAAFLGNSVQWSGHEFVIERNGEMRRVPSHDLGVRNRSDASVVAPTVPPQNPTTRNHSS